MSLIGLIHYKIIIHCFIDGYSRFILAIQVSNNNRASTVLDLFQRRVVDVHGLPSRVRGDHGTENLKVAEYMEQMKGPNRGSYIWGRCVASSFSNFNLAKFNVQECSQYPN